MAALKILIVVPARAQGQIGAGKVVPFTPRDKRRWIPLPQNARPSDRYDEYEVSGDSLEGRYVFDGCLLSCRTTFDVSEIKPDKICIVLILSTNEQTAKMVQLNAAEGKVTLYGANPSYTPQVFSTDEIEILAVVDEIRHPA